MYQQLTAVLFCTSDFLVFLFCYLVCDLSNHKSTTSCLRGAGIERCCLTTNLVMLTSFLVLCSSHLPLVSLPVIRYGACRRSGRRRCAWTGPLQRNVIHDTIKLLNGDVVLGWAFSPVLARHTFTGTRKTHIITFFLCLVFYVSHTHEALTTPSPLPAPRSSAPSTPPCSCSGTTLRGHHCSAGVTGMFAIHDDVYLFF